MKKRNLSIVMLLFFVITMGAYAQKNKNYTDKDLIGNWVTKVNEPVDGKCIIKVNWKADHTTEILFVHKKGTITKTSSKWKYEDPDYTEVFPDGSIGKAKIKWINENKFILTIIQNQDTENYKGRKRVFIRKK